VSWRIGSMNVVPLWDSGSVAMRLRKGTYHSLDLLGDICRTLEIFSPCEC
jgi:hypothetical protein